MLDKLCEYLKTDRGKGFKTGFLCCACLVLAIFLCYGLCGRSNGPAAAGVDSTIAGAGCQQQAASAAVGDALSASRNAENAISQAGAGVSSVQSRIERSAGLAGQNAEGLDHIANELKKCRELAEKNSRIIGELGEANPG